MLIIVSYVQISISVFQLIIRCFHILAYFWKSEPIIFLIKISVKTVVINIYPNPASDYVIIDYGFIDWNKGNANIEIIDELGRRVYREELPKYSGVKKIDISQYATGVYHAAILRQQALVGVAKFVKQ